MFLNVKAMRSIVRGRSAANYYSIPATSSLVRQFNTRNTAQISIKVTKLRVKYDRKISWKLFRRALNRSPA
ncbi:hypothetical protein QUB47_10670 [Microcoleus sp. AT9_B5]